MTPSTQDPRLFVALYTDEDVSTALAPALRQRGYTARSTAEAGHLELSDEAQLAYAAEQSMVLLTYNAQDFIPIAREWYFSGREHAGIVLSSQFSQRQFGELLRKTLRFLDTVTASEVRNQVIFLQRFQA